MGLHIAKHQLPPTAFEAHLKQWRGQHLSVGGDLNDLTVDYLPDSYHIPTKYALCIINVPCVYKTVNGRMTARCKVRALIYMLITNHFSPATLKQRVGYIG